MAHAGAQTRDSSQITIFQTGGIDLLAQPTYLPITVHGVSFALRPDFALRCFFQCLSTSDRAGGRLAKVLCTR